MTSMHGVIIEIKNGTLLLNNGVHVRVPGSILARVHEGDTITLYVHAVTVKKDAITLFGFLTDAERRAFIMFLESDDSDPVGTLSMVSAGVEPPDPCIQYVLKYLRPFMEASGMSEDTIIPIIKRTERRQLPIARAQETLDLIAKERDK